MELAVALETFDSDDGFTSGFADGELAGAARSALQQNGAGTTLAFAASVFCSGQAKLFAQGKEQRCVRIRFEDAAFSVNLCVDWSCHVFPQTG